MSFSTRKNMIFLLKFPSLKELTRTLPYSTAHNYHQFYVFTRWGRTGQSGACKLEGPFDDLDEASALFTAKFKDKTGNNWEVDHQQDRYIAHNGEKLNTPPPRACSWYRTILVYSRCR